MMFYVYVYHDGEVPIYVGKGKGNRAKSHTHKSHNKHLQRKLAKMKLEGRDPFIQIIDAPDEASAFEMEELLIAMIGRVNAKSGPLLNKTSGGDGGLTGFKHSEESKAKISAANTNPTAETRSKMSIASSTRKREPSPLKGRPLLSETKAKISLAKKGQPSTFKGKSHSAESKAKISASRKLKKQNHA